MTLPTTFRFWMSTIQRWYPNIVADRRAHEPALRINTAGFMRNNLLQRTGGNIGHQPQVDCRKCRISNPTMQNMYPCRGQLIFAILGFPSKKWNFHKNQGVKLWIMRRMSAMHGTFFKKNSVRMNKNGRKTKNKLCNSQKALKSKPKN